MDRLAGASRGHPSQSVRRRLCQTAPARHQTAAWEPPGGRQRAVGPPGPRSPLNSSGRSNEANASACTSAPATSAARAAAASSWARFAGLPLRLLRLDRGLALPALGLLAHAPHAGQPGHARHAGHPAAARHLRHHLARLEEPVDEVVDVAHLGAGPAGDPRPARAVEDLRVLALGRGHRLDDRCDPVELALVDRLELVPHARPSRAASPAACRSSPSCGRPASARGSPRG